MKELSFIYTDFFSKILLWILVFVLIILWIFEFLKTQEKLVSDGNNYILFSLDVSKSMNVQDMDSESRLLAAKEKIIKIIEENPWYEYALNIFAWESQRVVPFTSDTSLFTTFLAGVNYQNLTKQGSNIAANLEDALASFGEDKTWILVLITDGDEEKIDIPPEISTWLQEKNIESYIIGVWTKEWGFIPNTEWMDPYVVFQWQRVIATANSDWLKTLASDIWGLYKNYSDDLNIQWVNIIQTEIKTSFPSLFLIALLLWISYMGLWIRKNLL